MDDGSNMSIKRPKPGMALTNGEVIVREGGFVDIGVNDSRDNWHEITEEEYNRIKAEEEKEYTENI